jgi:hypothetical protein
MDATPDRSAFSWPGAWPGLDPANPFGLPLPGGGAMESMGKAWMQEMTGLLAARLHADAETLLAMGACTTLTELALLQQRWLSEAGQAYTASAQRLAQLATEAAKPAAAPAETAAAAAG